MPLEPRGSFRAEPLIPPPSASALSLKTGRPGEAVPALIAPGSRLSAREPGQVPLPAPTRSSATKAKAILGSEEAAVANGFTNAPLFQKSRLRFP